VGGLTLYVVAQFVLSGPLLSALHTATLLLPVFWPVLAFSNSAQVSPEEWPLRLALALLGTVLAGVLAASVLRGTLNAKVSPRRKRSGPS
jgi:hypothetical protein